MHPGSQGGVPLHSSMRWKKQRAALFAAWVPQGSIGREITYTLIYFDYDKLHPADLHITVYLLYV